jgi:UDP-glucose 4-epimerase
MERVLVTGATNPLGRHLIQRLQEEPGLAKVIGVEPRTTTDWMDGIELVAFEADDRELVGFLADQRIDTVIHAGMVPARSGSPTSSGPADVIGTMRLCAAVGSPRVSVRALLLVSSSDVYPAEPHTPLLQREDDATADGEAEPAASLLEAEEYARELARRLGHLDVAILRLAELGGGGLGGPLSSALLQPLLPDPLGYDPQVQWLHADDAVEAIAFAARLELAGVYNVASDGVLRWSEARALRGRPSIPVLPFEAGPFAPLLRRIGIPHLPEGTGDVLRFGSALDASKLRSAGWQARHDQHGCLRALGR